VSLNRSSQVLLNALLLGAVYVLLAAFSYGVSDDGHRIALVWLPASITAAWIIGNRQHSDIPLYISALLANCAVSGLYGDSLLFAVGGSAAKVLGIYLAVILLKPRCRDQLTVRDAAVILAVYVLLAVPVAAALGASVIWYEQAVAWGETFFNWWLGEAIGAVLLLLPALVFANLGYRRLVASHQLSTSTLLLIGLFTVSFVVLKFVEFPFAYLTLPLMAIALLCGMVTVAVLANLTFLILGAGVAWGWWQFPILQVDSDIREVWAASAAVVFGPMMLGLAVDEIRRRQHQLSTLEERLELASQSVELALWDWDLLNDDVFWDDRMRRLYDIGPCDDPLSVDLWRTRLHPDDVHMAEQSLNDALAGKADYRTQFRLRKEDGSYRSIQAAGIVIRNAAGEAVRMVGMNWDVSELVSAQKAVKSAEEKLNAVIEAASEFSIITTSTEGVIELFSAGAERLLGYTREELVGKASPALFHDLQEVAAEGARLTAELGYPVEGFEVFVAKARLGEATSQEWTYVRKDGQRIPVNLTVTVVRDQVGAITGYLGVARDIALQKTAEKEIRAAHNVLEQQIKLAQQMRDEFESLFELAPGAMLVLDAQGRIVNANGRAHQLFAFDQNMQGTDISALLPQFNAWRQTGAQSGCETQEETDWAALRADGVTLTVSLEYSPLLLNGVIHTIVNVYDITAQKEAERVLQRSRDLAESANRAKTEFLANMSHEIRTPLNAVLGAAQLLSYTTLDKKQSNHVGMISAAGQALLALLNDVLDVSKIEAGKMELSHEPFLLSDVIEPLATIMSGNAAKKNIELVIEVDPQIPRNLVGDAMRFQQVLVNFAGNAIKFTEEGEVVVAFSLVAQEGNRATIEVCVQDSGIGMDDVQLASLFKAFSQADSSITRRFGGTGLGLTICKKLVELMQGQIRVSSQTGKGSEFCAQVVLDIDASDTQRPVEPDRNRRVLLADASAASRRAMRAYCDSWGWQCEEVESSAAARKLIEARRSNFDVLIFNQNLDAAEALDALAMTLPSIKLVGHVSREKLSNSPLSSNKVVMLSKPITSSILLDGISEALGRFANESALVKQRPAVELARLDGVHLLLVEDTPSNQVIIMGVLEQAGAHVEVADNGADALQRLRDNAASYDAVLMDVQMPVMDGFTATRKIRDELHLTVPIIAMTAGVLAFERQQCIDSGMDDFIGKPLDIPTMLKTISRYVSVRASQAEPAVVAAEVLPSTQPSTKQGVFDPERIMGFVRGKPAREKDIIDMIERIVAEQMLPVDTGRRLLEEQRYEEAARHFHTLKGSMGNFGANGVMAAAQALEQSIKLNQGEGYEALLQDFTQALQDMVAVAGNWLVQYRASNGVSGMEYEWNDQEFTLKLQQLRDSLKSSDIEAVDIFNSIESMLKQKLGESKVSSLVDAMDELRFEDSLSLLEDL